MSSEGVVDYYTLRMKKRAFRRSEVDKVVAEFKWKVKRSVVDFKLRALKEVKA